MLFRSVSQSRYARAVEAIDDRKQSQLGMLAEAYVSENPGYQDWTWRFDAILLDQDRPDSGYALEHLKNVF